MSIAHAALTGSTSATDGTSFTTASITPTANALVIATVHGRRASGDMPSPTLSGNGLTWVEVGNDDSAGNRQTAIFRALGASPSAGAVTINYGAVTATECSWSISEFTGIDTSGTNGSGAVVQFVTATGSSTESSVTLAALASTSNVAYGVADWNASTNAVEGSGFTAIHNVNQTEVGRNLFTEYKLNETVVTSSRAGTTTWKTMAIEIDVAPAVGTTFPGYIGGGYF